MPKKTSSSDSDRGTHRRKKQSRRRSSSSSGDSSDLSLDGKSRHRSSRRSRSRSRDRSRRQRSRSRTSSRSPRKRSRHSRSRSSSRGRRSKRSSRSRSSSRGKSHGSKHKKTHHRHKSRSPSKSKGTGTKSNQLPSGPPEKDEGTLKMKIQQVLKAAANANAELREKGLLPSDAGSEIGQPATMSISDQMKRVQTIDEINAPSFSQQTFLSSRSTGKQVSEKGSEDLTVDAHSMAIFGLASPKLGVPASADASIKKLESWKENPEKLLHENFFIDQQAKEERWKKKLMALRRKSINGEAYM